LGILEEWFGMKLPWNFAQVSEDDSLTPEERWLISVAKLDALETEHVLELKLTKELRKETLKFKDIQVTLSNQLTLTLAVLDELLQGVSREIKTVLKLDPVLKSAIANYEMAVAQLKLGVNGKMLQQLGIPRGPEIGEVLKEVRLAWLENRISTDVEEKEFVLQQVVQRRK
jgi:tRNA nucleotidyltransferase (CCA-adding enzyme)